ncbi:site-specific integrase [Terasakiella sp. SH-1]|nr:site-specific integrase [Terasakiella sp. SH-1]
MANLPNLYRRGNIWRYRRRVPHDIQDNIGRKEFLKSLNTADYSTAVRRYRTVCNNVEQIIAEARGVVLNDTTERYTVIHKSDTHEPQIKAPPTSDDDGLRTLIQTVVEEVLSVSAPRKPSLTLDELYHRYMDDPARSRSRKTIMTYQSVYNVLMEIFGDDKPIGDIDREDCRQFMNVVRHLPANAKKRFPRKSLVEISELAKERRMKPMAPLTINKYVNKLSAMLNWAVEEELLDHNPAIGLKVADPIHAQDKRLPFSDHQLIKIFEGLADKFGAEYWVPHIGLYNGLRLNEICQLNVEDVVQKDETWCFNITCETDRGIDDKILKTKASERVIPIHPQLLELGFMRYLKQFEKNTRLKLFPDIKLGTTGYRSDTFSKRFARFLKSIDADAPKTSFHSFRHNFRDALREADVRHEIAMQLGGWADGSRGKSAQLFYGKGFTIKAVLTELNKVRYVMLNDIRP